MRDATDERQQSGTITITPTGYTPSSEQEPTQGVRWGRWLLLGLLLCAAILLGLLFSARSVTFSGADGKVEARTNAWLQLRIGDVHLLLPGKVQVNATAPGYEPYAGPVFIGQDRNQVLPLPFLPLPGRVTLRSDPAGATVTINGSILGRTPIIDAALPAGSANIEFALARYQHRTLALEVRGRDEQQQASVRLEPDWAEVSVSSEPTGAEILIDGKSTGERTPAVVEALAGEREFALRLDGHQLLRQRLLVAAGEPASLGPLPLQRADRTLTINSQPAGAGVTLNGLYQGETPLTLALDSQVVYRLRAYKAGYGDFSKTLRLSDPDPASLTLTLQRETGKLIIRTEPARATVTVNGRTVSGDAEGTHTLTVPTSRQRVAVTLAGYASYSADVLPKRGMAQELRVKLLTLAEARRAALTPTLTTAAGQRMILVEPKGRIMLGASRREPGRRANETLREVELRRLFYVSEAEVTNAEFKQFSGGHDSGEFAQQPLDEPELPVVQVSWIDAALYCNWLSERDKLTPFYRIELGKLQGIDPTATGYRLLTEAEWHYVAEQVETDAQPLRFPWGSKLPPPDRHGNYADRSASNAVGRTLFGYNDNYMTSAPIKQFPANKLGLYDLGGNVAEWVHDYFETPAATRQVDPLGPEGGEYHVIKGASWMSGTVTDLRLSYRDFGSDGRQDVGFRLARYAETP